MASRKLLSEGLVRRVGILDCDWHCGDGTDDIRRRLKLEDEIVHRTSDAQSLRDSDRYIIWLESAIEQLREANEIHRETMGQCKRVFGQEF